MDTRLIASIGSFLLLTARFPPIVCPSTAKPRLHAGLVGVRVPALRLAQFGALAVAVVVSLQTVGLLLSVAMLIVPAAAARLWTTTLLRMSLLACAFGVVAAVVGLTLAFHLESAPGATIAITAVGVLVVSAAFTMPRRATFPIGHARQI